MNRPHVTLKLATSLDGRIATASGESRWITGEAARAEVQKLRAAHDAVLIGSGTACADDPELLARTEPPPQRQPVRVVFDTEFSLAPRGRLFDSLDRATLLVIGGTDGDPGRRKALDGAGAKTVTVPRGPQGIEPEAAHDLADLRTVRVPARVASGGVRRGGTLKIPPIGRHQSSLSRS